MKLQIFIFLVAGFAQYAGAQKQPSPQPQNVVPSLRTESNLVLVPTLVTTETGELVFSLSAHDFTVTDNGVEQKVTLDDDMNQQPLAMAIVVQTGGVASQQLPNLRHLEIMLDVVLGNMPHEVTLVSFDSRPHLLQNFTPNLDQIGGSLRTLRAGDNGTGILDGLVFALNLLRKQPPGIRRAVLLISEAVDHGSTTRLDEALRDVSETNTAIYSLTFSTSKAEAGAAIANRAPPVCLLRDEHGCITFTDYAAAIVLGVRMGIAALSRNAPETVASLTGGEYMRFNDEKSLEKGLAKISNDLPNRYTLSFQPVAPTPGLHTIQVSLKGYPNLRVSARTSYWAVASKIPSESHP